MKKQLLMLMATFAFCLNANALFEVRLGYGVNAPSEDTLTNAATLSTMSGFNLDGIVELPMIPFGFGLRYESMGLDVESGAATFESDMTRVSILLNYRIIDLFAYFGFIGTIGVSNEVTVKGVPLAGDLTYDADLTYSIGVEGGLSFGLIMIGAELGYNIATYENTANTPSEIPFDGIYAKALVGVGF